MIYDRDALSDEVERMAAVVMSGKAEDIRSLPRLYKKVVEHKCITRPVYLGPRPGERMREFSSEVVGYEGGYSY